MLSRGHLKQFKNSPAGRAATFRGKVLVKQITFDWSIANRGILYQMEVNARCIAMEVDSIMWAMSFVMSDGSVEICEYFEYELGYKNPSVPHGAIWTRIQPEG